MRDKELVKYLMELTGRAEDECILIASKIRSFFTEEFFFNDMHSNFEGLRLGRTGLVDDLFTKEGDFTQKGRESNQYIALAKTGRFPRYTL